MDGTYLFLSVIFSSIGLAYFAYGKKQNLYFMLSGIALMLYPYVVGTTFYLILFGIGLAGLPFILDRLIPLD